LTAPPGQTAIRSKNLITLLDNKLLIRIIGIFNVVVYALLFVSKLRKGQRGSLGSITNQGGY